MTIEELVEAGKAKVLHKVELDYEPSGDDGYPIVMVLDTETTGLDPLTAQVIELGYIMASYDPDKGCLRKMLSCYNGFSDPGYPISQEITAVTGLTDEHVEGKYFDIKRINSDIDKANFIVAHNASFDRPFCELIPNAIFHTRPWACSFADIDWKAEGISSSKLDYILMKLGYFFDAHRAIADVEALIKALQVSPCFQQLLHSKDTTFYRVSAIGSSFRKKDTLKNRGYQALYKEGKFICWYTTKDSEEAARLERDYLIDTIFCASAPIRAITAMDKYSVRENP